MAPDPASPRPRVRASSPPRVSASPRPRVPEPLHPSSFILHPSFFARWRNAILGTLLVLAGIGAALITVLARRTNEPGLTMTAAIISLVIAGLMLILIVPPLARSARLEILRLDIPFSVTTGGAIFLVIVVVVGFAAWNTGNNLLFLVLSLLVSAVFVGWMAARASLRDLVVSARFPDHIFAGEPAPVIVTLRNLKRVMPSFSTFVEARGPAGEPDGEKKKRRRQWHKRSLAYFTYVPHAAAAEQRVDQLFAARGHVLIDGFELSTQFPFGFFRRRRRLRARDVDIVVYPKPEPISDELHLLPMYAGRLASLRRGPGHDLFSLRDYQPQDDLRHVDWKATARTRRLTVREFTSEDERRITIILDLRAASDEVAEKLALAFERGVTLAASLVHHFIEERAEVRLILGADSGKYGSGLDHLYDCLRRLALVMPEDAATDFFSSIAKLETSGPSRRASDGDYAILLTAASPGSIPSRVWRSSHVIYL